MRKQTKKLVRQKGKAVQDRYYFKPDFDTDIDIIRKDIKKDYEAYEKKYAFVPNLRFDAILEKASSADKHFEKTLQIVQKQLTAYLSLKKVSGDEYFAILQTFMAIWNYFPNADMGKSPIEAMRAEVAGDTQKRTDYEKMANTPAEEMLNNMMQDGFEAMHVLDDVYTQELTILIKHIGGIKKDADNIHNILADSERDPVDALKYLYDVAGGGGASKSKKRTKYSVDEIQDMVRSLAGLEWYTVSEIAKGQYTTRLFQEILEQAVQTHMKKHTRPPQELMLVGAMSQYQYIMLVHMAIAEIMKRFPEKKWSILLSQTVHHLLTWVAVIDTSLCTKYKKPIECAAMILQTAWYISHTIEPEFDLGCTKEDLEKVCKKENDVIGSPQMREAIILQLSQALMCHCADPLMLLVNVLDNPDDIKARVSRFAPCVVWDK